VSISQKIQARNTLNKESIYIADWDVTIEVRSMSARQRATLQSVISADNSSTGDKQEQMWTFLFCNCCFDIETGEPVFSAEDMEWLLDQSAFTPIDQLATKCLEVSAIGKKASDDLGKSSSDSPTETE
jgi:hypothetical protein